MFFEKFFKKGKQAKKAEQSAQPTITPDLSQNTIGYISFA